MIEKLKRLEEIRKDLTKIYVSFPISMQKALDLRADSILSTEISQIKKDVKLGLGEQDE